MTRLVYWSINLIVIPTVVMAITLAIGPKGNGVEQIKHSTNIMFYVILFVFPILSILRMKYLNYTWKEMLLTITPFSMKGRKLKWRSYFGK